jgi:hypothetical protein
LFLIWSCTQEASPPSLSPHTKENTKKDAQGCFTSLADLEHVRQDADFFFIYAGLEFIIYSVFGHVATRLVVMLHPGSVFLEMPSPSSMTTVFFDVARGSLQSSIQIRCTRFTFSKKHSYTAPALHPGLEGKGGGGEERINKLAFGSSVAVS